MIKTLLQVEPSTRPTCEQILAMDVVKKRMPLLKNLPEDNLDGGEENYDNLNLLGTIKLPKNLAHLTKDLPKSNYVSNRGDSATTGHSMNSKLIHSHPNQIRLQSEPALSNGRQLPSIYSMKEPKYGVSTGPLSEQQS